MTTPERGLFEALISRLHAAAIVMANLPEVPGYNGSILQLDDIEAGEIAQTLDSAADELGKMEQRLAEAESNNVIEVDGLRVGECTVRAYREQIKIAEEQIAQLRARCEDLGNIAYKANAANEHWNEFGPEHGFDECMNRLNSALTEIQPQPAQEPKG